MPVEVLSGRVFLVVTGASRGIGAEIAVKFSRLFDEGSQVLLLARDADKLKKTAEKMPKNLTINYESVDLATADKDKLKEIFRKYLKIGAEKNFDRAVIVHNVGSMGVSKLTIDVEDRAELQKYYDLNVFSPSILNSVFMRIFTDETKVQRLVVNVTSLVAIKPFKSLSFYGPGKAAREMFFRIFAAECPQVNVLNWSPGPVETDMLDEMISGAADPELRNTYRELRDKKEILTTEQSCDRLITVLKEQKYKSGDHVDYYDDL